MPLVSGTKLGPYEVLSSLGAGGMGEVYRARDLRLERDVAIKVLPASLAADTSLRQRLEREAKAISKLSHPYICTLHDIGHQDGVDFLVMELLEGETLEQRLLRGPLPLDQTLRADPELLFVVRWPGSCCRNRWGVSDTEYQNLSMRLGVTQVERGSRSRSSR